MIATPIAGWCDACDDVVDELHSSVDVDTADAVTIARQLGYEIVFDKSRLRGRRASDVSGHPTIFVKLSDCPERTQWDVALSLGDRYVDEIVHRCGHSGVVGGQLRHQVASEFAKRLLLPRGRFLEALEENDGDLFALKTAFPNVSYELLTLAMLRWPEESSVTLCTGPHSTRRFGNRGTTSQTMSPFEYDAWEDSLRNGWSDLTEDGVRVQGWAVDGRVFLRTTFVGPVHEVQRELFATSV